MVSLGACCVATLPFAGKAEVVGAFPPDMVIAEVDVELFRVRGDH